VGTTVRVGRGEPRYPSSRESRLVHFGLIMPNFGTQPSQTRIRSFAEHVEDIGFDSVCGRAGTSLETLW
jgi:hypothetical protein